jgi:hypothetical protein
MPEQQIKNMLNEVACEVFQSLAFVFPADEPGSEEPAGGLVTAAVKFEGAIPGTILLSLPASALGTLACNMLALDEAAPPTKDQELDALKELANVLCGNLLPAMFGLQAEYHVHSPTILPNASLAERESYLRRQPGGDAVVGTTLWLEFGPAAIEMCMAPAVAKAV